MNTRVTTTPGQEIKFDCHPLPTRHKHFSDFYTDNFLFWNSYITYARVSKEYSLALSVFEHFANKIP